MTIRAGPIEQSRVLSIHRGLVIDGRRVARADVAPLANEIGPLGHEHPIMERTVRVVAIQTIFTNGGMLKQHGSPFFLVAFHAQFVHGSRLELFRERRPVRIMATVARQPAFLHGHMGRPLDVSLFIFVTLKAGFNL